jgi:MOSC domain-containing protein YiiM
VDLTASGKIEAIWIKRAHRGPMDPVRDAVLIEGKGIQGNVDRSRFRQVTLLSREAWEQCMNELGATLDPSARRANLLVSGVAFAEMKGRTLKIGDAELLVRGEVKPCERMDEAMPGLRNAMRPEWRGGVFAQVVRGGAIQLGDPVQVKVSA